MKKILLISGILIFLYACSSDVATFSQLQDRNGVFYLANKDKPFTGEVVEYNNGKVAMQGRIDKGLREGLWVHYYPNGQKKMEGNFKEGVKDGTWTYWRDNGQQQALETYKYGKLLSNEGSLVDSVPGTVAPAAAAAAAAVPEKKAAVAPKPAKSHEARAPEAKVEKAQEPVPWTRLKGGAIKFLDGAPYTGPVVGYHKNGLKDFDGYLTNGKKSGKWTYYDSKGNPKVDKYY
ncbi:MAG: hypothetical protein NTU51_02020 [Bacteroidetes bacterium]|nr:hypothetical protein [Bacteroidota bacterium]